MDNLFEKFKEIPEEKLAVNFHKRLMRKLFFVRFKIPFLVFSILALSVIFVSGWRLWIDASELGTISFFKLAFADYQISGFLSDFFSVMVDFVPVIPVISFLLGLILMPFAVKILLALKRISFNNGRLSF